MDTIFSIKNDTYHTLKILAKVLENEKSCKIVSTKVIME